MKTVRRGITAEQSQQEAAHTLFTEGNERSNDQLILKELLGEEIRIMGMRASFHVSNVAEALHEYHPTYYFLIDRDCHSDEEVAELWNSFPNPDKKNLLIWRRKEIENYFLIPDFVLKSNYLAIPIQEFIHKLQAEARKRIFFEAANRVIIMAREKLKRNWIRKFNGPQGFETKEQAKQKLLSLTQFRQKLTDDGEFLGKENLVWLFEEQIKLLLGESVTCEYGCGRWLELISGKKLFHFMAEQAFIVHDLQGREVYGDQKRHAVIKQLMRLGTDELPDDFQQLHKLIRDRVRSPGGFL